MADITINANNWQQASEINKVIEAINERREAIYLEPIDYVVPKVTNIQTADFWNNILTKTDEIGRDYNGLNGGAIQNYPFIKKGDNLQEWIANWYLVHIYNMLSSFDYIYLIPFAMVQNRKLTDPVGCGYGEVVVESGSSICPQGTGWIYVQGGTADDYFILNEKKLNSLSLTTSADLTCGNGVVGQRTYASFIAGKYSNNKIEWSLVDTKRGYAYGHLKIMYFPDYKYYPHDVSGYLHA